MEYVSNNNLTIAREKKSDNTATVLTYYKFFEAMRNKMKEGKGKEKHA